MSKTTRSGMATNSCPVKSFSARDSLLSGNYDPLDELLAGADEVRKRCWRAALHAGVTTVSNLLTLRWLYFKLVWRNFNPYPNLEMDIFTHAGIFIYPLALCSAVAVSVTFERLIALRPSRVSAGGDGRCLCYGSFRWRSR